MTKEEFLTMWKEELKSCEDQYHSDMEHYRSWRGRGHGPKKPSHILFRNRLSSRLHHMYKEQLEQLPEDERLDIERTATTMMLDKVRELNLDIDTMDLTDYIRLDPKNIQYIDLAAWSVHKDRLLAEMVVENPEVLSFLTAEQFNKISEGAPDYIVQLVKENSELANRPPLSEIIASDSALTREITILKKESELEKLRASVAEKEKELAELKGKEEIEVNAPTEIE